MIKDSNTNLLTAVEKLIDKKDITIDFDKKQFQDYISTQKQLNTNWFQGIAGQGVIGLLLVIVIIFIQMTFYKFE